MEPTMSTSSVRRWKARIGWALMALIGTPIVLVGLLLLVLQTSWGAEQMRRLIEQQVNVRLQGGRLEIGALRGNFVRTLAFYNVALRDTSGQTLLALDTLEMVYLPEALLKKRVHLRQVRLIRPRLNLTQQADSAWNLPHLFAAATDTPQATTAEDAPDIWIDQLTVREGTAILRFYAPLTDSIWQLHRLDVQLDTLRLPPAGWPMLAWLRLEAVLQPARVADSVHVTTRLSVRNRRFTLDTLRIWSTRSQVTGRGTLLLPADTGQIEAVDFRLKAYPLAFYDLMPFVAIPDPNRALEGFVSVQGNGRLLQAQAALRTSTGGTLTLTAAFTPLVDGPVHYQADIQIRQLNPAFLGGPQGRLDLKLTADLRGTTLQTLDGQVTLVIAEAWWGGYRLDPTRLQVHFVQGDGTLSARTGLRGARLQLDGRARLFTSPPSFRLVGTLQDLDPSRLLADTSWMGQLNLAFLVEGKGMDRVKGQLMLQPSQLNRAIIDGGQLTVHLRDDTVRFALEARLAGGRMQSQGRLYRTSTLRYEVQPFVLEQIDVAALLGDTLRSTVNGRLWLRGSGMALETLHLEAALELDSLIYGPYRLAPVRVPVRMDHGRLTATPEIGLGKGRVMLRLQGWPMARRPRWQIDQGRLEQVDLAVTGAGWTTLLNGSFEGFYRGATLTTAEAEVTLHLRNSRINAQGVEAATLTATLRRGLLTLRGRAVWPDGSLQLEARADSLTTDPVYTIERLRFQGVNLAAWTGQSQFQTRLNGALILHGRGADPRRMQLSSRLRLDASEVNGRSVAGQFRVTAIAGRWEASGRFGMAGGQARFDVGLMLRGPTPRYALTFTAEQLDLMPLLGIDTLSSRLSLEMALEGEGVAPSTMQVRGHLHSEGASLDALTIDRFEARFSMEEGLLHLDTLQLRSNVAAVEGKGQLAVVDPAGTRLSELTLQVQLHQLQPLRRLVGARLLSLDSGYLEARAYGRPGQLRFEGRWSLQNLIFDELRLVELKGRTAGELDRARRLAKAEARTRVRLLTLGTFQVEAARAELRYDGRLADYELRLAVDRRHTVRLEGQALPEQQAIRLTRLDLRLHDARWRLLQPATFTYGTAYRVQGLLLYTEAQDQQLAVDGVIDPDGTQSFVLTLEGFRLETITDLFELDGLGGALSGTVDLTGPATAPRLSGQLLLDLVSEGRPVGDLRFVLQYDSLRLWMDARLLHQADASTMTLRGTIPLDLRLQVPPEAPPFDPDQAPLDLTLTADTFAIAWIQPFLDPEILRNVRGRLVGQLHIGGTPTTPLLDGQVRLFDGAVYLPALGVSYRNIRAEARMTGNRMLVTYFELHSGGRLTGSGTVQFEALTLGTLDLRMEAQSFLAADNRAYRTVLSGTLTLRGTTEQPEVAGNLQVISADIYLIEQTAVADMEHVRLTEADLQMLRQYFGVRITEADTITFDFYEAARMQLNLRMERDVWLRSNANPEMTVQFTGTLTVQKEPYQDLQLFGTIEVIPERSYIVQFGKRFDITEGTLSFNGPADDPELKLKARYVVPAREDQSNQVIILLSVSGRLERLDLTLTSENPSGLDLPDMISYIVFGRPAGQALASLAPGRNRAGGGLLGRGAGLALGQLAGIVEGLAGEELGLDVVEIEPDGLQGAKLTVGKYVSPRLFAAVSRPIAFGRNIATQRTEVYTEFTVEYTIFDAMIVRVTSQGTTMRINLLWRYAY
ncbi:MAG: translocation/assembly module TamB domain-containing protein [Rhodothermus sp.]|nr:translocation/assembly module TamB domain-containing protein [Rhodothermus sp.]